MNDPILDMKRNRELGVLESHVPFCDECGAELEDNECPDCEE